MLHQVSDSLDHLSPLEVLIYGPVYNYLKSYNIDSHERYSCDFRYCLPDQVYISGNPSLPKFERISDPQRAMEAAGEWMQMRTLAMAGGRFLWWSTDGDTRDGKRISRTDLELKFFLNDSSALFWPGGQLYLPVIRGEDGKPYRVRTAR